MRWKQKIPALPTPSNIARAAGLESLLKVLIVGALAVGGFVFAARALGTSVPLSIVVRVAILGALAALAFIALKKVRDLAKKATLLLWVALLVMTVANLWISTKPAGINVARAAALEGLLLVSWAYTVKTQPKDATSKRFQRFMPLLPLVPLVVPLVAGIMFGSATLPENGQHAAEALDQLVKQNGPGATADLASGIGATLADAWRSLWAF